MKNKFFVIGSILVLFFVGIIFFNPFEMETGRGTANPEPKLFFATENPVEAQLQDIEYFKNFYVLERSLTPETMTKAKEIIDDLTTRVKTENLTELEFALGIAKAVAAAQNGHTFASFYSMTEELGRLPYRGHWFSDGYYIVSTKKEFRHLLGAKITHLNGIPVETVDEALRVYSGYQPQGYKAFLSPRFLEHPEILKAAGVAEKNKPVEIGFVSQNGEFFSETFSELTPAPILGSFQRLTPVSSSDEEWIGVLDSAPPIYLEPREEGYFLQEIPEVEGVYIAYRQNYSSAKPIQEFGKEVLNYLEEKSPKVVILDHRFNGGGDYTQTVETMRKIPELLAPEGTLYIATSSNTYSAGIFSVAFAKETGGKNAILIGEPVGDRLVDMWAETGGFRLPHSLLYIGYAIWSHDLKNGCFDLSKCFRIDFENQVIVDSLDPEIPAPLSFLDYKNGVDPVLKKIFEIEIGKKENSAEE